MKGPRALPLGVTLSAVTFVAAAVTGLAPATSLAVPTAACRPWEALHVTGTGGQRYVIRNKPSINRNDRGMCISDPGLGSAFTVTASPGLQSSRVVRAYPYIGTGCFKGACAAGGQGVMPAAGSLGNYTVSWATVTPPSSGVYDSSLDLWLGPRSGVGASELMIWLRYSKPAWWVKKKYPAVRIDGAKWYLVPKATEPGRSYLSFRRAQPAQAASLRLAPFMAVAERLGYVSPSSLLWCTQAGFEIWSGGRGLAISRFSVSR